MGSFEIIFIGYAANIEMFVLLFLVIMVPAIFLGVVRPVDTSLIVMEVQKLQAETKELREQVSGIAKFDGHTFAIFFPYMYAWEVVRTVYNTAKYGVYGAMVHYYRSEVARLSAIIEDNKKKAE